MCWHLQDLFHHIQTSHAQVMIPPWSQISHKKMKQKDLIPNSFYQHVLKSNTEFYIYKMDLNTVTSVAEAL